MVQEPTRLTMPPVQLAAQLAAKRAPAAKLGGTAAKTGGTASAARRHSGGEVAAQSGGTAAKLAASMPLAAKTCGTAARRHGGKVVALSIVGSILCGESRTRLNGARHEVVTSGGWPAAGRRPSKGCSQPMPGQPAGASAEESQTMPCVSHYGGTLFGTVWGIGLEEGWRSRLTFPSSV
eukprot:gene13565-biopygen4423